MVHAAITKPLPGPSITIWYAWAAGGYLNSSARQPRGLNQESVERKGLRLPMLRCVWQATVLSASSDCQMKRPVLNRTMGKRR